MENRNVKFCLDCGRPAIVLTGPDAYTGPGCGTVPRAARNAPTTDSWHRWIATRYCEDCAAEHKRKFNAKRQRKHRRKHSYEKRLLKREINRTKKRVQFQGRMLEAFTERNQQLESEIVTLRLQLEEQRESAYRQGRQDERHRLTGRVLEGLGNRLTGRGPVEA